MRISKYDLCRECLSINSRLEDGKITDTVGEMIDSPGYYSHSMMTNMTNNMILSWLERHGGCSDCISIVRRATN